MNIKKEKIEVGDKNVDQKEDKLSFWQRFIFWVAICMLIFGVLIVVIFIIILNGEFDIGSENIAMDSTGQVGDFIGGIAGSLWALSGVLLFYLALEVQRKELGLQRKEFQKQREELILQRKQLKIQNKEHETTRIVNLIYRQLDQNYTGIDGLSIFIGVGKNRTEYSGLVGLIELEHVLSKVKRVRTPAELPNEKERTDYAMVLVNKLQTLNYLSNEFQIFRLLNILNNSTLVINKILENSSFNLDEKNELQLIYTTNLGDVLINSLKSFQAILIAINNFHDYKPNGINLLESINQRKIFQDLSPLLSNIIEFRK